MTDEDMHHAVANYHRVIEGTDDVLLFIGQPGKVTTMTTQPRPTDEQVADAIEHADLSKAASRDRSDVAPIEAAVRARAEAEKAVTAAVRGARARGITWVEIASALGVSHQAAIKRYKPLIDLSWTAGSTATGVGVLDALDEARAQRSRPA